MKTYNGSAFHPYLIGMPMTPSRQWADHLADEQSASDASGHQYLSANGPRKQYTNESCDGFLGITSKHKMDLSAIDNIVFGGIDHRDAPKYCDAYIESADMNGVPMTFDELEELQTNNYGWCYDKLMEQLY